MDVGDERYEIEWTPDLATELQVAYETTLTFSTPGVLTIRVPVPGARSRPGRHNMRARLTLVSITPNHE